ncbi:MAG: hypothetical protein IT370_12850, partial [Deltaproteobacteria bacterium]|nr:hypothetical protein [Deltaproteobacteria bacterium]
DKVKQDFVDEPKKEMKARADGLVAANQAMMDLMKPGSGATPAQIAAASKAVADANQSLIEQADNMNRMKQQWDIMRNDVFHTDKAATDAKDQLDNASQGSGDETLRTQLLEEFELASEDCATPEQVAKLQREYEAQLAAL